MASVEIITVYITNLHKVLSAAIEQDYVMPRCQYNIYMMHTELYDEP